MSSIRCSFWSNDDLCGARDYSKLCEAVVSLPLASLDSDVTPKLQPRTDFNIFLSTN